MKFWLAIGLAALAAWGPATAQTPPPIERARTALQQKHWDEARTLTTEALAADSNAAGANRIRGWALYGLKQYRDALDNFTCALRLDPHDNDATLGTGRYHRLLGDNDATVADFIRAHEKRKVSTSPT